MARPGRHSRRRCSSAGRLAGPDAPEALESLQALGEVCHAAGDNERARALLEESLERHRRVYGDRHARTARVLHALGALVAAARYREGRRALRRALEIRRAALPADHPDVAEGLSSLAGYHYQRREYERARDLWREALATFRKPEDRRHPIDIAIRSDLASVLGQLNAPEEAEALQREAIEIGRQVLGPDSATVANLLNISRRRKPTPASIVDADRSYRASFETHRALYGEDHWRTRNVARNVGRVLELQRRYAEALPWMDRAAARWRDGTDADRLGWSLIRAQRAQVLFRLGRHDEALAEASDAVELWSGRQTDARGLETGDGPRVARADAGGGGPSREAEPVLTAALDHFAGDETELARRAEASCELGRARVLQGGQAEDWQRLRECLPTYRAWGLADREAVAAIERLVSPP